MTFNIKELNKVMGNDIDAKPQMLINSTHLRALFKNKQAKIK
jgi:hypothetical protein